MVLLKVGVEDPRHLERHRVGCPSFHDVWNVARDGGVAEVGRNVARWLKYGSFRATFAGETRREKKDVQRPVRFVYASYRS